MKIEQLAQLHKALSVPVRLKILELIGERPLCVSFITRCLEISQPAVSQHLAVLKRAGLVSSTKRGYTVHYKLDRDRFEEFRQALELFPRSGTSESIRGDSKELQETT